MADFQLELDVFANTNKLEAGLRKAEQAVDKTTSNIDKDTGSAQQSFENLLGTRGTTTTQLTPSGKARFGDQLVDVMADGEMIASGTEVVVREVHGNRILVRAANDVT